MGASIPSDGVGKQFSVRPAADDNSTSFCFSPSWRFIYRLRTYCRSSGFFLAQKDISPVFAEPFYIYFSYVLYMKKILNAEIQKCRMLKCKNV